MVNEITLKVVEPRERDVGRGRIRIDDINMRELGITPGDVIEIRGYQKTGAIAWPAHIEDQGRDIIRMDKITRNNAQVSLKGKVRIRKAEVIMAKNVEITPTEKISFAKGEISLIKQKLLGFPISVNDIIQVSIIDQPVSFLVTSIKPVGISLISKNTRLKVSKNPISKVDTWTVPEEPSEEKRLMRLTPFLLARAVDEFKFLILETVKGEWALDSNQVDELISRLQKIRVTMTHLKKLKTQSSRKIIFLGLSQAGKTSIRDVVFEGKDPEDTQNYAPTLNYERQIEQVADEPITVMDLGGQEVFLKRFLSSMSSFIFSNVAVLVFICDIATAEKFPASLKAFVEGVSRLEEMSDVQPAIYVLLHKTDLIPDFTQRAERMEFLMTMFQNAAAVKNITFLETSIYDNSIHEAFKRITAEASEVIPEAETIEKEEDLEAIQQRLRLRPIQQVLHTLKFMNRLDEVLLISLDDPTYVINASDANESEVQHLLTLLDKSNELRLPFGVQSEAKRLGEVMVYKSKQFPHHLLVLISRDPSAMLETRNLQEIEETVRLLSNQLESMLKTPI